MGITWSLEIISTFFQDELPQCINNLGDLLNSIQGLTIFILFVCKEKTKKLLIKRFGLESKWISNTSETRRKESRNISLRSRPTNTTTYHSQTNPKLLILTHNNKFIYDKNDSETRLFINK